MINKFRIFILCTLLIFASLNTKAALRQYYTKVENSDWKLKNKSRLQCTLNHKLPGYEESIFRSFASKQLYMEFELDMLLLPKSYGFAVVNSVPPKWMPGKVQRTIADMPILKQYNGDLPEQTA